MATSNIHHSMDLAIILVDATTGRLVNSSDVKIFEIKDNVPERTYPMSRDSATYIYINCERVDRQMLVDAKGYIKQKFSVDYSKMPEDSPVREVYLVPETNSYTEDLYYRLSGKLKGITEIIGVNTKDVVAHTERYDLKRNTLHTFENASLIGAGGSPYCVIKMEDMTYELFHTDRVTGSNTVKLRQPLSGDLVRNSPVVKAVMGQANDDGNYILLIQKKNVEMNYLIRYIVDGKVRYQEIDLKNTEESQWNLQ